MAAESGLPSLWLGPRLKPAVSYCDVEVGIGEKARWEGEKWKLVYKMGKKDREADAAVQGRKAAALTFDAIQSTQHIVDVLTGTSGVDGYSWAWEMKNDGWWKRKRREATQAQVYPSVSRVSSHTPSTLGFSSSFAVCKYSPNVSFSAQSFIHQSCLNGQGKRLIRLSDSQQSWVSRDDLPFPNLAAIVLDASFPIYSDRNGSVPHTRKPMLIIISEMTISVNRYFFPSHHHPETADEKMNYSWDKVGANRLGVSTTTWTTGALPRSLYLSYHRTPRGFSRAKL